MGRLERVNQQVKRQIGEILQRELADPRLRFVTITEVDVSRDLHNAKIRFSVLGEGRRVDAALEGFERAKGLIRKLLGKSMNMRYTPELFFIYDPSIEMGARIEETLKEIRDEHEAHHSNNPEEQDISD